MAENTLLLPPIHFPLLGNSVVIGLFSLLHISIAGLTVGFIILAPVLEYFGLKNPSYTRLSRSLVRFAAVTFSLSGTFAVVMLELLIGLFPVTTVLLFRRFQFAIYIALIVFLFHLFFFYTYWYRWEKMRAKSTARHIAWGGIAAALILIWVGILDGIGSYMLTPPASQVASLAGSPMADFPRYALPLNPTWLPLVIHRLFGNLIVAFYAIAFFGGFQLLQKKTALEDKPYYTHIMYLGMKIGTYFLLIQPIAGIFYSREIHQNSPQAFDRILYGPTRWLVLLQFLLVGLLFFLSNFFISRASSNPTRLGFSNGLVLVLALFMILMAQQPTLRRIITLCIIALTFYQLSMFLRRGTQQPFPSNRQGPWLAVLVGVCAMATLLLMGTIREQGRRPYTVYGQIRIQDEKNSTTEFIKR